jgi:repressor LexA
VVVGEGLSPTKRRILEFVARRQRAPLSPPPSVAEVARAAGLRSTESAHKQLRALAAEGYVERGEAPPRQRRPVRLTEKGWGALGTGRLVGTIAAGRGLEPVAEDEAFPLTAELLQAPSGKERILYKVIGESMVEAGIRPGDLLVVEADPSPPDGAVVAATVLGEGSGDEATVKVLRRRGGKVWLEPRNGNGEHEDIVVDGERVLVHGTVQWFVQRARGFGRA